MQIIILSLLAIASTAIDCPNNSSWTLCATENGWCTILNIPQGYMSYGTNGQYNLIPFTTNDSNITISCNFGNGQITTSPKSCCYSQWTHNLTTKNNNFDETITFGEFNSVTFKFYELSSMRYGIKGRFVYRILSGSESMCYDTYFPDIYLNEVKQCDFCDLIDEPDGFYNVPIISNGLWTDCGDENGICIGLNHNNPQWIRYGFNDKWYYRFISTDNGTIPCNDLLFNDPSPNNLKICQRMTSGVPMEYRTCNYGEYNSISRFVKSNISTHLIYCNKFISNTNEYGIACNDFEGYPQQFMEDIHPESDSYFSLYPMGSLCNASDIILYAAESIGVLNDFTLSSNLSEIANIISNSTYIYKGILGECSSINPNDGKHIALWEYMNIAGNWHVYTLINTEKDKYDNDTATWQSLGILCYVRIPPTFAPTFSPSLAPTLAPSESPTPLGPTPSPTSTGYKLFVRKSGIDIENPCNNESVPCNTIDWALSRLSDKQSAIIDIGNGEYDMNTSLYYDDEQISIIGKGMSNTILNYINQEKDMIHCDWKKCWISLQDLAISNIEPTLSPTIQPTMQPTIAPSPAIPQRRLQSEFGISQISTINGGTIYLKNVLFDGTMNIGVPRWHFQDESYGIIENCIFRNLNSMQYDFWNGPQIEFINCTFEGIGGDSHPIISVENAQVTLRESLIQNNQFYVPLIHYQYGSQVSLYDTDFIDNFVEEALVFMLDESDKDNILFIDNCLFLRIEVVFGAVVMSEGSGDMIISNSTFKDNGKYDIIWYGYGWGCNFGGFDGGFFPNGGFDAELPPFCNGTMNIYITDCRFISDSINSNSSGSIYLNEAGDNLLIDGCSWTNYSSHYWFSDRSEMQNRYAVIYIDHMHDITDEYWNNAVINNIEMININGICVNNEPKDVDIYNSIFYNIYPEDDGIQNMEPIGACINDIHSIKNSSFENVIAVSGSVVKVIQPRDNSTFESLTFINNYNTAHNVKPYPADFMLLKTTENINNIVINGSWYIYGSDINHTNHSTFTLERGSSIYISYWEIINPTTQPPIYVNLVDSIIDNTQTSYAIVLEGPIDVRIDNLIARNNKNGVLHFWDGHGSTITYDYNLQHIIKNSHFYNNRNDENSLIRYNYYNLTVVIENTTFENNTNLTAILYAFDLINNVIPLNQCPTSNKSMILIDNVLLQNNMVDNVFRFENGITAYLTSIHVSNTKCILSSCLYVIDSSLTMNYKTSPSFKDDTILNDWLYYEDSNNTVLCEFSHSPTSSPSLSPSKSPTTPPTIAPSISPTNIPSNAPSVFPSITPTISPTLSPSTAPIISPSLSPTLNPIISPTNTPSIHPTPSPSMQPSNAPSFAPTIHTTTYRPSLSPTDNPSMTPTSSPLFCNLATYSMFFCITYKDKYDFDNIYERKNIENVMLYGGESLISQNCLYLFKLEWTGNLIFYNMNQDKILWQSHSLLINDYEDTILRSENIKLFWSDKMLWIIEDKFPGIINVKPEILWTEDVKNNTKFDESKCNKLIVRNDGYVTLVDGKDNILWIKPEINITTTEIKHNNTFDSFEIVDTTDPGTDLLWLWIFLIFIVLCLCVLYLFYPEYKKKRKCKDNDDDNNNKNMKNCDIDDDIDEFDEFEENENEDQMIMDWMAETAGNGNDGEIITHHIELQQLSKMSKSDPISNNNMDYQIDSNAESINNNNNSSLSSSVFLGGIEGNYHHENEGRVDHEREEYLNDNLNDNAMSNDDDEYIKTVIVKKKDEYQYLDINDNAMSNDDDENQLKIKRKKKIGSNIYKPVQPTDTEQNIDDDGQRGNGEERI